MIIKCIVTEKDVYKLENILNKISQLYIPRDVYLDVVAITSYDDMGSVRNMNLVDNESTFFMYVDSSIDLIDEHFIEKALGIFADDPTVGIIGLRENNIFDINNIPSKLYKLFEKGIDCESVLYGYVYAVLGDMFITNLTIPWKLKVQENNVLVMLYCIDALECGKKVVSLYLDKLKGSNNIEDKIIMPVYRKIVERYIMKYAKNEVKKNLCMFNRMKRSAILEEDVEEKIAWLELAAAFATFNFTGKYSDRDIEDELHKLSMQYIYSRRNGNIIIHKKDSILHVMTEAYDTGGHTRVVYDWIKLDKGHKHYLFMTHSYKIPNWLETAVIESGGIIFSVSRNDMYIDRSRLLYEKAQEFEKIILHIHQYDVVPLLAFSHDAQKTPVYFFNHSAHTFFIGLGIADVMVQFAKRDFVFNREKRGIDTGKMIMITIPKTKNNKSIIKNNNKDYKMGYNIPLNAKVITSMAPFWRFTSHGLWNFDKFICEITSEIQNVYYVLIGPDMDDARWNKLNKKSGGRILPVGLKSKYEVEKIFSFTDLYVDSFYFSSQGCVQDAINYGLPVLSINSPETWMKDFICKDVADLKKAIMDFFVLPEDDLREKEQKQYKEYYNKEKCIDQLTRLYMCKNKHRYNQFEDLLPRCDSLEDINLLRQFSKGIHLDTVALSNLSDENKAKIVGNIFEVYIKNKMD